MDSREILERCPLPLARGFRRHRNASGGRERHDAGYYLFEIYLKYVASIAIARYLAGETRDHRVNAALKGLARPSLGEWLRFLRECVRFLGEAQGEDPAIRSIREAFEAKDRCGPEAVRLYNALRTFRTEGASEREKTSIGLLLDEIIGYRNRVLGHGAPLDPRHYEEFASLFEDAFPDLVRASPFLTALRLVLFERPQVVGGSRVESGVIEYMGLHPIRRDRPLRLEYGAPPPREGGLHLLGEDDRFVPLDPLLIAHDEDVYFLNEAEGAPEYLSYTTGDRHKPSSAGTAQQDLFERILGYQVDEKRLSRIGDDVAPAAAAPAAEEEGRRLGDYRIVREIGRGAMGAVFEAIQESLGRRVALKVLPGTFALDPKRVERFRREARATARIHHPSIVPVYEVGEVGGTHYYAMEYIDGPSLDRVIAEARERAEAKRDARRGSTADPGFIAHAVEQTAALAEGLEQAHKLGLVHRDIKPSNILVDSGGRYVLVDFGLVREEEAQTLTRSGEMVGTLGYMSPEQVSRGRADARSDVYGLGVTLYEVLTLHAPFEGESEHEIQSAILFDPPARPRKHNPRLNRDLETILLHTLEKKPERRYESAAALAGDLRRFLRYEPIQARARSAASRAAQRIWRHRGRAAAVAAVLVLLASLGVLAIWKAREDHRRRVAEYGPTVLGAIRTMQAGWMGREAILESGGVGWVPAQDPWYYGSARSETGADPLESAIHDLTRAIENLPERADAYYHRAWAFLLQGRSADALKDLEAAIERKPAFVAAHTLRATVLEWRGDVEDARAARDAVLASAQGEWARAWLSAHTHRRNEAYEEAVEDYRRLIALSAPSGEEPHLGASIEIRLGRGNAHFGAGDFMEAIADYEVVSNELPDAIEPVLLQGKAYLAWRKPEAAERTLRALWERVPDERKDEVSLAVLALQSSVGVPSDAALNWVERIRIPSIRERSRAIDLLLRGQPDEALAAAERALDLDDRDALTRLVLGLIGWQGGRLDEAERCFREAMACDPAYYWAHVLLGMLARTDGRLDDSVEVLERARSLAPGLRHAIRQLAYTYKSLGRDADAFRELCAVVREAPASFMIDEVFENLWAYLTRPEKLAGATGELDSLLSVLEEEVRLGGPHLDNILTTLVLGWLYHPERRDIEKALAYARKANEPRGKRDPETLALLAEVHAARGEFCEAILALEEAVRLWGCPDDIVRQLDALRAKSSPDLCSFASVDAAIASSNTEILISEDAEWRFFRGKEEPSGGLEWTEVGFPDGEWERGTSGFGYGNIEFRTEIADMRGAYLTLYIRHRFTVQDPAVFRRLSLSVRVDDGFVAYLNGKEAGRHGAGAPGRPLAHDGSATEIAAAPVYVEREIDPALLRKGENCLAIQGLNINLGSSDFLLRPALQGERRADPEKVRARLEAFRAAAPGASDLQAYFEGRILQETGDHEKARVCFEDLAARTPQSPEPHLRLAEVLRAAGDPDAAEKMLREILRKDVLYDTRLAALWAEISRRDLRRSVADLLAVFPAEDRASFRLQDDARWDEERKCYVVTDAKRAQAGRVFHKIPVPLDSWIAEFEIRIEAPRGHRGGADGMAFSLFRDFDVPRRDGSDLNLKGDGYAVEFDTFCGGSDPPNPHIAIVEDDPNKHRVIHELARGFEIDVWHPVRIVFDRGTISVSFDGQEVIAGHEIAGFERFTGQFGFTAATGLGYERHLCRNIRWRVIER